MIARDSKTSDLSSGTAVVKEVLRFDAVTLSARVDPNNDIKLRIIHDNDNMIEFCDSAALPTCVCQLNITT